LPKEEVMKRMMIALLSLSLCACAGVSRAQGNDALSGTWRGVLRKGALESVVIFEFSRTEAGYRGTYWGTAPVGRPVPLTGVEFGHSVRFEVPELALFDGELAGEMMEGTFQDANGAGSFRLEKQPDWEVPLA
jgi:hypothetical protein